MKTPVAIIGGGPAGTTSAMYLAKEGIPSVIIEQEDYPRYHVGESMTGEAGKVIRDLGLEHLMLERGYPQKKGVSVYGAGGKNKWYVPVTGRDSDHNIFDTFTWQVRRSDFDRLMLDEALARGAELLRGRAIRALVSEDGSVEGLEIQTNGSSVKVQAELVLDCTGQASFLASQGVTGPKYLGSYDKQIAIFSQVADAVRDDSATLETDKDNTLIFYNRKFHWAWFIPLDEQVVSVGVVVPAATFLETRENPQDFLVRELHDLNPELKQRLPEIQLVEDVHVVPNYSFQVRHFGGPGYLCIGDSHRFVDPIFSFGLNVAFKEAQFAAPFIRSYLECNDREAHNSFAEYQLLCEKGIDVLEDSIDLFWEQPLAFAMFIHVRYREELIDVFAGRIYENQPSKALIAFRKMLDREGARETSYRDSSDDYSVPIGSRYHPERAPIWQVETPVASTEDWMISDE